MQIIQPFQAKILEDVAVGELLSAVVDDATIFAVKLMDLEGFNSALAVLKGYGEHLEPHLLTITNDIPCASYGNEWVFEVDQPDEISSNAEELGRQGAACIGPTGVFLRIGRDPFNVRSSGGHLDLSALKFGQVGNPAFAVRDWKVWANTEDRDRQRSFPLIVHS